MKVKLSSLLYILFKKKLYMSKGDGCKEKAETYINFFNIYDIVLIKIIY